MWDDPPEVLESRLITWLRIIGCAACVWLGLLSIPVGLFGIVLIMPHLPLLLTGLLVTGVFCFWWVFALLLAPRFAVNLLVVSLSLGIGVALLPPWILQSRGEARRTVFVQNLRRSGWHYQLLHHYGHSVSKEPNVPSRTFGDFSPAHDLTYWAISEPYPDRITLTSDQRYPAYEP